MKSTNLSWHFKIWILANEFIRKFFNATVYVCEEVETKSVSVKANNLFRHILNQIYMIFPRISKRKEQLVGLKFGTLIWRGNSVVTDVYVVSNSGLSNVHLKSLYERNVDALNGNKIFIFYADGSNRIIDYGDLKRN